MPSNGRLAPAQRLRREIYSLVADFLDDVAAGNVKDIETPYALSQRADVRSKQRLGFYGRDIDEDAARRELAHVAAEMRARVDGRRQRPARVDKAPAAAKSTRNGPSSRKATK